MTELVRKPASASNGGELDSSATQVIPGAKTFTSGIALGNQANVRAPEGAGTTTLLSTDNRWQIFNLSAGRTVLLPSSGVKSGDLVRIDLRTAFPLIIQSSGAAEVTRLLSAGYVKYMALIDSPITAADWLYVNGSEVVNAVVQTTAFAQSSPVNGTWYDGSSTYDLTLYAGTWTISSMAYGHIQMNSGTGKMGCGMAIRTGSTIIASAIVCDGQISVFSGHAWGGSALTSIVTITTATTYRLSIMAQTLGGGNTAAQIDINNDASFFSQLQAVRTGR